MLGIVQPSITTHDPTDRDERGAKTLKKRLTIAAIVFIFAGLPTLYFIGKFLLTPEWERKEPPLWAHLADSGDSQWYINTRSVVVTGKAVAVSVKEVQKQRSSRYTLYKQKFDCSGMNLFWSESFQEFENEQPLSPPQNNPTASIPSVVSAGAVNEVELNAACWLEAKRLP